MKVIQVWNDLRVGEWSHYFNFNTTLFFSVTTILNKQHNSPKPANSQRNYKHRKNRALKPQERLLCPISFHLSLLRFLSILCSVSKLLCLIGWPLRASWVWIDLTWILWAAITEMFKQTLRQIRMQKAEPGMLGTSVWGSIKHRHRKKCVYRT